MALIPEQFLGAVLSVGIRVGDDVKWIGTGFFIVKKIEENIYQPMMVTNKHVLAGHSSIVIRLRKKDSGNLVIIDMPIENEKGRLYSAHPDESVDVAVVLLNGGFLEMNDLEFLAFDIDLNTTSSSDFLSNGGGEGSVIYMLGFPMGLVDIDSNMPICRFGCVARADEQEIIRTKNMLFDIQNFPGNSGSPIITKPEIVSIGNTIPFGKASLIGIIHSYISYSENTIDSQTGKTIASRIENSGIARANPVEYIIEVVDMELERNGIKEKSDHKDENN